MRTTWVTVPSASSCFMPASSRRTALMSVSSLPSRTTVMLRPNCHGAPKNSAFIMPVTKKMSGNTSSIWPCGRASAWLMRLPRDIEGWNRTRIEPRREVAPAHCRSLPGATKTLEAYVVLPVVAQRLLDVELAVAAAEAVRRVARRERILDPLAVGDELVLVGAGRQLDGDGVRAGGVRGHEVLRVVRLPVVEVAGEEDLLRAA